MHPDNQPLPPRGHSRAARRTLATLTASALLALPTIAFATSAQADDTCVPRDAWTETVAAVGDPTMIVENPAYVPAVPPVYQTVTHPAVTEVRTVADQRYTWHPRGQVPPGETPGMTGSTPLTQPDDWTANTRTYNGTDPLDTAFFVGNPGAGSWFYWTVKQAEVVITPAWNEEVLVTPGVPAQGDRLIEVTNPSYVAGYQIDHPAVVCTVPMTGPAPTVLAETGSEAKTGAIIATVLVLLGAATTVVVHRRLAGQR